MYAKRGHSEYASTDPSRQGAADLNARPMPSLWVVRANGTGRARNVLAGGRAVRVVGTRVRCGVAEVRVRAPASVFRVGGRAVTARAAIGVDRTIAARRARIRGIVGRHTAANARRRWRTVRIGGALVVRATSRPDKAFEWKAPTVGSAAALRVRRTKDAAVGTNRGNIGRIRLGCWPGPALRCAKLCRSLWVTS
jgi:hypothetical protein